MKKLQRLTITKLLFIFNPNLVFLYFTYKKKLASQDWESSGELKCSMLKTEFYQIIKPILLNKQIFHGPPNYVQHLKMHSLLKNLDLCNYLPWMLLLKDMMSSWLCRQVEGNLFAISSLHWFLMVTSLPIFISCIIALKNICALFLKRYYACYYSTGFINGGSVGQFGETGYTSCKIKCKF